MKRKHNHGFAFAEVIFIIVCTLIALMLLPAIHQVTPNTRGNKCKANLSQIRTALTIYQLDLGRQVFYPPQDGGRFIAALYAEQILVEEMVYICPSTPDIENGALLGDTKTGEILVSTSPIGTDTDAAGPLSYAGRINGTTASGKPGDNAAQGAYPGLFRLSEDVSTTPMACDDVGTDVSLENHENGKLINILFLDGHVDHIRRAKGIVNDPSLFGVSSGGDTGLLNPMAN